MGFLFEIIALDFVLLAASQYLANLRRSFLEHSHIFSSEKLVPHSDLTFIHGGTPTSAKVSPSASDKPTSIQS
jgi:hypothetical protein